MVTWPWKDKVSDLPENYQLAFGRLRSTLQKLAKSPALLKQYNDIIQEQLNRGIIERVTSNSEEGSLNTIQWSPPSKNTTKVHIVCDALAKTRKNTGHSMPNQQKKILTPFNFHEIWYKHGPH